MATPTLTVKETAAILNCNPETVRRMCRREEIEFIKLGNSPRSALRIVVDQPIIKKALGGTSLSSKDDFFS